MSEPAKTAADLFSEVPEPRNTREKILYTALDLFHSEGFHAIGLDRILKAVGVTKTTFYNHFESRDDLIREAIVLRDEWDKGAFERMLRQRAGFDPRKLLLAMFDVLDEWFTADDFRGCLFLFACAEFPAQNDPIHQAAAAHYMVSEETITQMAEAIGIADPAAFAVQWSLLLQGAITRRMTVGDDRAAVAAKALAQKLLDQECPAG